MLSKFMDFFADPIKRIINQNRLGDDEFKIKNKLFTQRGLTYSGIEDMDQEIDKCAETFNRECNATNPIHDKDVV